ncbi:RNase_H superfamily protein [Natronorubrum thiooxidans]|uniref:RNase_H superfamily protein n=1 Tax=Natronorubrum thiooxidans TaxID=308853 RepID=A0A1N7EKS3_9EURY|nr:RNase_H superfamily protein [Natronorubrum thiooxidans]
MRTGEPLEWDRHEAYCEDDCRALWHVYERLRDAAATSSDDATGSGTTAHATRDDANETADSEQTGLGDF